MLKPVLLIYGLATSGKTTLGSNLRDAGLYDVSIEVDDVDDWLGKCAWIAANKDLNWDDPAIKSILFESARMVARVANLFLRQGKNVCISGVWVGWDSLIMQGLQDYRVAILRPPNRSGARKLWIKRGQDAADFDKIFPVKDYDWQVNGLLSAAKKFEAKGKLIADEQVFVHEWQANPIIKATNLEEDELGVVPGEGVKSPDTDDEGSTSNEAQA